jgi:hypothetical protein
MQHKCLGTALVYITYIGTLRGCGMKGLNLLRGSVEGYARKPCQSCQFKIHSPTSCGVWQEKIHQHCDSHVKCLHWGMGFVRRARGRKHAGKFEKVEGIRDRVIAGKDVLTIQWLERVLS